MTPVSNANSGPPIEAIKPIASRASPSIRASAAPTISTFRSIISEFAPAPNPTTNSGGRPRSFAVSNEATVVLPMPISPNATMPTRALRAPITQPNSTSSWAASISMASVVARSPALAPQSTTSEPSPAALAATLPADTPCWAAANTSKPTLRLKAVTPRSATG